LQQSAGVATKSKQVKQGKRRTSNPKLAIKCEVKEEITPNKHRPYNERSGRCPVCQMPFSLLSVIESPTWHVDSCLEAPYSSKEGTNCMKLAIHL